MFRICRRYEFRGIDKPLIKVRRRRDSQSYYGDKNLQNELRFLDKVFSDNSFKINWFLRRKAYGRRYFDAAKAYKANREIKKVRKCILKSFFLFPIEFFDKLYLTLVIYAILGNQGFKKLQKVIKLVKKLNRTDRK